MSHPLLAAVSSVGETLKGVSDANPTFLSVEQKSTVLLELTRVEAQVAELKLRVLADAGDLAATDGSRDAAAWLTAHARLRPDQTRADLKLATALDRRWSVIASGLREGRVNLQQARVIARALEELPDDVPADLLAQAEATLVAHAADYGPRDLAKLGRRILEVVAPDVVDEAEAKRLAELESAARRATRLQLRRQGDGTTRIWGRLPDATATRLATYLAAFANPRKNPGRSGEGTGGQAGAGADGCETGGDAAPGSVGADPLSRLPYPRRLGEAFCQFLETADPKRLPIHGGDATTLIVTMTLDQLRTDLATAGLLDAALVPGDPNVGDLVTAAEARRLACTAQIIPAVLGGDSEVLDLGRARRLFSAAQRKAMLLRDQTCRAEGCDIPGTWAEAHHWVEWARGGSTDLSCGVLLCSHHHHRAHDPAYTLELLADVRFTQRT